METRGRRVGEISTRFPSSLFPFSRVDGMERVRHIQRQTVRAPLGGVVPGLNGVGLGQACCNRRHPHPHHRTTCADPVWITDPWFPSILSPIEGGCGCGRDVPMPVVQWGGGGGQGSTHSHPSPRTQGIPTRAPSPTLPLRHPNTNACASRGTRPRLAWRKEGSQGIQHSWPTGKGGSCSKTSTERWKNPIEPWYGLKPLMRTRNRRRVQATS